MYPSHLAAAWASEKRTVTPKQATNAKTHRDVTPPTTFKLATTCIGSKAADMGLVTGRFHYYLDWEWSEHK